jgi:hypothetical protein
MECPFLRFCRRICLEATTVEIETLTPSVGEHRRMVPVGTTGRAALDAV